MSTDTLQTVTALLLPDDKAYLKQQLEPVTAEHRLKVYRQYCEVWQRAADAEPNETRRDNAGRVLPTMGSWGPWTFQGLRVGREGAVIDSFLIFLWLVVGVPHENIDQSRAG